VNDTRQYFDPAEVTRMDDVTVPGSDGEASEAMPSRGEALGRYVVLDTVGQGGMGVVVAAYDSTLDRRVALKLLHTRDDPDNQARLLREAKALAKLSHPCVVDVYDVGEIEGRVFIAMEFIDGPNLRTWVRDDAPGPAKILAVYRSAARGLQAAHDASVVHRDFKPDNVLIGADARARVTDFGLALEAKVASETLLEADTAAVPVGRLTQAGMVMGTPAYMPPEQHAGKPTDHRSDQFSFCVSLYESLYGLRPFSGANGAEYCAAIRESEVPPPPASVAVPRRVHRALVRGLSANPDDRFPSMRHLLRALTPASRKRSPWLFAGVGGLAVGAGAVALNDSSELPCSTFDDRIDALYRSDARGRIEAAFESTGSSRAAAAFTATATSLDAFAARWAEGARDACLATERGEQSDRMLDLRMHCLDRSLLRFEAMTEILASIDPKEVDGASKLATQLPDLSVCADLDALPQLTVLPSTPTEQEEAAELVPVLERLRALILTDRLDDADALLLQYAPTLDTATYPPVQILYRTWHGRLLVAQQRGAEARDVLKEAHLLALQHGLDMLASRTATALGVSFHRSSKIDLSMHWFHAGTALARSSGSRRLEAVSLASSADALGSIGRLDEAIEVAKTALALVDGDATYPPRARAELLLTLASQRHNRDGGDAGLEEVQQARAAIAALDGEEPTLMKIEIELGQRANIRGDFAAAFRHTTETIRLAREVYGEKNAYYAAAIANHAIALKELGRHEEAIEHYAKAAAYFRTKPSLAYNASLLRANIASLYLAQGRRAEARTELSALTREVEEQGFTSRELGVLADMLWCNLLRLEGDLPQARSRGETALRTSETLFGKTHYRTADALASLAWAELEAKDYAAARGHIERARAFNSTVANDRARASYIYGRVLWESEAATARDKAKALDLIRAARVVLTDEAAYPEELEAVVAWLERNDPEFVSRP
jgi:serine/threonine protein kinase